MHPQRSCLNLLPLELAQSIHDRRVEFGEGIPVRNLITDLLGHVIQSILVGDMHLIVEMVLIVLEDIPIPSLVLPVGNLGDVVGQELVARGELVDDLHDLPFP